MNNAHLPAAARVLTYREIREVARPLSFAGAVTCPCDYVDSRQLAAYRRQINLSSPLTPAHRTTLRGLPGRDGF